MPGGACLLQQAWRNPGVFAQIVQGHVQPLGRQRTPVQTMRLAQLLAKAVHRLRGLHVRK